MPVAATDPPAGTEWLATGEPVSPTERALHALNIVAAATQPSTTLDVRTRDTFPTC